MTDPAADQEPTISWLAVPAHAPVYASDGIDVGRVLEVAALPQEDIFHGIVFQHHGRGRTYLAPAVSVARITQKGVYLTADSAGAEEFEEFHQLHIERLGLKGILRWKHVTWKDSSE